MDLPPHAVIAKFIVFDDSLNNILLARGGTSGLLLPEAPIRSTADVLSECVNGARSAAGLPTFPTNCVFLRSHHMSDGRVMLTFALRLEDTNFEPLKGLEWVQLNVTNTSDEHIWKEITAARELLLREQDIISLRELPSAIKRATTFVADSVNRVGAEVGWDHNLDIRRRIGVIGTAIGILILSLETAKYLPLITAASDTLLREQLESGGWGTRSLHSGTVPTVYSTAYAMCALSVLKRNEDLNAISRAGTWLQQVQKQGGWGPDQGSPSPMVTPTALVVLGVAASGLISELQEQAVQWLKGAQYPEGGWGCFSHADRRASKPSAPHTAHALYALLETGIGTNDGHISAGLSWLLKGTNKEGLWDSAVESEYVADNSARIEFKHPGHQLSLLALLRAGVSLANPKILRGVSGTIGGQCQNGAWEHELSPGHQPIWATFYSTLVLARARDRMSDLLLERNLANQPDLLTSLESLILAAQNDGLIQRENTSIPMSRVGQVDSAERTSIDPVSSSQKIKPGTESPWRAGGFFLAVMMALIACAVLAARYVDSIALPITLIFVLIAFTLVMISALRQGDRVGSDSLVDLIREALSPIGLLMNKPKASKSSRTKKKQE